MAPVWSWSGTLRISDAAVVEHPGGARGADGTAVSERAVLRVGAAAHVLENVSEPVVWRPAEHDGGEGLLIARVELCAEPAKNGRSRRTLRAQSHRDQARGIHVVGLRDHQR